MSSSLGSLLVDIGASTARLERDLNKATKDVEKWGKKTASVARNIAGAIGVGFSLSSVISATVEQERVTKQLEATLRSTGGAAGYNRDQLTEMAASLQRVTTYGDEAIIGAQSLLLTFTKIGGETFGRATEAILNVSTAMGQDLKSSALQVGKALNDPILGMTALSRSGIQFSEAQKKIVKDMVGLGDIAGAQNIILKELEVQFGGSARAARDTFGGALIGLKNAFGDLLEAKNGLPAAAARIEEFTSILSDPKTQGAADALFSTIITGFSHVATAGVAANVVVQAMTLHFLQGQRAIWGTLSALREYNVAVRERAQTALPGFGSTEGLEDARRIKAEQDAILAAIEADIAATVASGAGALDILDRIRSVMADRVSTGPTGLFEGVKAEVDDALEFSEQKLKEFAKLGAGITDPWMPEEAQKRAQERWEARSRGIDMEIAKEQEAMDEKRQIWKEGDDFWLMQHKERWDVISRGLDAEIAATEEASEKLKSSADDLGWAFSSAFEDAIVEGKKFSDVLKGLAQDIMRLVVRQTVTAPMAGAISGMLSGLFSPAGGVNPAYYNIPGASAVASANGNVFAGGRLRAFASGGIFDQKTYFPMQNGTGMLGEAGPEAIMPLTRGADGKLGVKSQGGGGSNITNTFQIDARGSTMSPAQFESIARQATMDAYQMVYDDVSRRGPIRRSLES